MFVSMGLCCGLGAFFKNKEEKEAAAEEFRRNQEVAVAFAQQQNTAVN